MLALLFLPIALLVLLALRAARHGEHRLHGHLMLVAWSGLLLRGALAFPNLAPAPRRIVFMLLGLTLITLGLGRLALGWREGDPRLAKAPRCHRAMGTVTLLCLALALSAWWLRWILR